MGFITKNGRRIYIPDNKKDIRKLEKKASNVATGAKKEKSINQLYKLDEEIKDMKSDSKRSLKRPAKPDIYDKNKNKRRDDFYKTINKLANDKSLNEKEKAEKVCKAIRKSAKPSSKYTKKKK